jgi:hypothetical protein
VLIPTDQNAYIGLGYKDGVFEQPVAPVPSPENVVAANSNTRDTYLAQASVALAPLQMAVALGEATADETAQAKAWLTYTRALKAVDLTQQNPTWPTPPQ